MDLAELRNLFRIKSGDTQQPYLWLDDEVDDYINQAEREAADRAQLIYDDSGTATVIDVVAGTSRYEIDAEVVRLDYAELDDRPLTIIDKREVGPRAIFVVPNDGGVELNFVPEADGTLRLGMYRLPIEPMIEDDDVPEVRAKHHAKMIDWALHLGYLKTDSDTFDQGKADRHEAEFIKSFGQRVDANVRRKQQERRRHTTRCVW